MLNKKIYFIFVLVLLLALSCSIVSASDNNISNNYENEKTNVDQAQQIVVNDNEDSTINQNTQKDTADESIVKKNSSGNKKTSDNTDSKNYFTLNVTVKNNTIALESDSGNEVAITKNITTVNNKPDVTKLGVDYAYADEDGTYTILGSEIRRVMKLDSYCQQIYGYVPKYTFFRVVGSNVKYVISREKWNVIARSLHSYHVNKGYTAVNTPYAIKVNLSGKSRYSCIYYDAQEWINGHQYTCGPTSMSMISQALNCYASERKLAGVYSTTASDGTGEDKIIKYSPSVHMKLTDIADTESAVKSALNSGKMVFWHISGHYMCIVAYNSVNKTFLCLNPSGPSHNIKAVQWATWKQVMNTDRSLKGKGFMSVRPNWNLTTLDKKHAKYYYFNMGGKYTTPANSQYCNNGFDNFVTVTPDAPATTPKTTNQTKLIIKSSVFYNSNPVNSGNISVYLNNKLIKTVSLVDGIVSIDYTLPAYTPDKITVKAIYNPTSKNLNFSDISVTFNKFTSGKKYTNTTTIKFHEKILVESLSAKKDDNVTFTAYVYDSSQNPVNTGKVVFKLNGNTLKQNGNPIKINVVNGVAKLNYTIPAYSAKQYRLTAVFGNDSVRYEANATLTIEKIGTNIIYASLSEFGNEGVLLAKVVDVNGNDVVRDTKITVKINSKTVVNKVKVVDGIINMTLDLSRYRIATHNLSILVGENGVYKFSSLDMMFERTNEDVLLVSTRISDLKTVKDGSNVNILANVVDESGNNIVGDMKMSIKVNGKTVVNKAVITNGVIDKTIDFSGYDYGSHVISLIVGAKNKYKSTMLYNTIQIP